MKAVAFTSALAPALEALSYVALGIVVGVGGWASIGAGDSRLCASGAWASGVKSSAKLPEKARRLRLRLDMEIGFKSWGRH